MYTCHAHISICVHTHMQAYPHAEEGQCGKATSRPLAVVSALTEQGRPTRAGLFPGHGTSQTWGCDWRTPCPRCQNFLSTALWSSASSSKLPIFYSQEHFPINLLQVNSIQWLILGGPKLAKYIYVCVCVFKSVFYLNTVHAFLIHQYLMKS